MAGEWIKMRIDLAADPAVIRIRRATGLDADAVVGKLHRLWGWADTHTTDGFAAGLDAEWVDEFIGCPGFAAAMVAAGWLEADEAGVRFANFDRHNGQPAKARALKKDRMWRSRGARSATKAPLEEEKRREEDTHTPRVREAVEKDRQPGWAATEWDAFLPLWNACKRAARWDGLGPPAGWVDAAASPGWLQNARKAVERLGRCAFFENPLAVTQFLEPGWVDRINAGAFDNAKRQRAKPERGGDFGGAPAPPKTWDGPAEEARRAMLERSKKLKEEVTT